MESDPLFEVGGEEKSFAGEHPQQAYGANGEAMLPMTPLNDVRMPNEAKLSTKDSFVHRTVQQILCNTDASHAHDSSLVDIHRLVRDESSKCSAITDFHSRLDSILDIHYPKIAFLFEALRRESPDPSAFVAIVQNLIGHLVTHKSQIIPSASSIEKCRRKFQKRFQKNPSIAKRFFSFAQNSFSTFDYIECIKNCNLSIVFALPKSKTLSFGYYLRSQCLSMLNIPWKSFLDLETAIDEGILQHYPSLLDTINSLRCELLLQSSFPPEKSSLWVESPIDRYGKQAVCKSLIQGTSELQLKSSKLRLERDSVCGRKVTLNCSVKEGEILFIEKPEFAHLLPQYEYFSCDYCLKPLDRCFSADGEDVHEAIFPCSKCINVAYCSKECSRRAYEEYHRFECSIYGILSMFGIAHLASRMMLLLRYEKNGTGFRERSRNYVTNIHYQNPRDLYQFAATCLLLENVLKLLPEPDRVQGNSRELIFEMLENILILISNAQAVELSSAYYCGEDCVESFPNQFVIGTALYDILPTLNHSCVPNISIGMENGSWVVVRALKDMEAGSELRNSYGVHAAHYVYEERCQIFKEQFHFQCDCQFCAFGDLFDRITNCTKVAQECLDGAFLRGIPTRTDLNLVFATLDNVYGRNAKWILNFRIRVLILFWKRRTSISKSSTLWLRRFVDSIRKIIDFYDPLRRCEVNEYMIFRCMLDTFQTELCPL